MNNIFQTFSPRFISNKKLKIPPELFIPIVVSVILGFAQYWLHTDEEQTPEELAKGILEIMVNGAVKAFGLLPGELMDIDDLIGKE